MTDFLKIAKSIVVHFAHICAYGVETVLKYARSTLEERLDVSIVYSNERCTFCIFLVTVRKLFLASTVELPCYGDKTGTLF